MTNEKNSDGPRRWWQWVLMYPTLIISVAGAIPTALTLYQSYKYKVPFGVVGYAVAQNDVWRKNLDCISGKTFDQVKTSYNISVSVVACPSGDVLIRVKPPEPESKEITMWIELKQFMGNSGIAPLLGAEVLASPVYPKIVVAQASRTVICQRWIADGLLLMRVRYDNGQCFDETINTYTGVVISSTPAPCDARC